PNAARPVSERIALDRLSAMPQTEVKAVTPWTEGEVTFGGVAFDAFARSLGIGGGAVILRALNAYEISLDVEQVIADGGVLALRMDGRPIPVRDKGPVWLVFPSVERPDLAASDKTHMWIWQIDEIRFLGE
ncbi:MAG: molybdopterin-dependent oxidoreductase, partial [Pseudomonadota bacterium]|nr:molybdopterin-dependent oxidoreductase [Pseudomonadota bacterium]